MQEYEGVPAWAGPSYHSVTLRQVESLIDSLYSQPQPTGGL